MTNKPRRGEAPFSLLRDCSSMDASLVERLRATVEISLTWAEQTLDILIQLDTDLQAYDLKVKQQRDAALSPGESGREERAVQAEQSIQPLRDGVRDIMMSMQNQDVIGQSIERVAGALEKRVTVIERVVAGLDSSHLPTDEIAELHRAYQREDDMHHQVEMDENEYEAAA